MPCPIPKEWARAIRRADARTLRPRHASFFSLFSLPVTPDFEILTGLASYQNPSSTRAPLWHVAWSNRGGKAGRKVFGQKTLPQTAFSVQVDLFSCNRGRVRELNCCLRPCPLFKHSYPLKKRFTLRYIHVPVPVRTWNAVSNRQ